jgi:hypothetical protein
MIKDLSMKNSVSFVLLLCFIATILLSCSEDDLDPYNRFAYNNKTYQIERAYLYLDSKGWQTNGVVTYEHSLSFLNGLTVSDSELRGKGSLIRMILISSTPDLEPGEYVYMGTQPQWNAGVFYDAAVYIDFNAEALTGDIFSIHSGKVIISKSGNSYTIEFQGSANSSPFYGRYSGKFIITK